MVMNNANINAHFHDNNGTYPVINPEPIASPQPGRISSSAGPVIRSVEDAITYLQQGGNLHLARYECFDPIKTLLLAISGDSLENAATAFADTCDWLVIYRVGICMLSL